MDKTFHSGNRKKLYEKMKKDSLLVLFSGTEVRKTNDEYYPFYTDRNFLYLTGLNSKEFILVARKGADGSVKECVYILPSDSLQERWTGKRLKHEEVEAQSGIVDVREARQFAQQFHSWAVSGDYEFLYLDLYRVTPDDRDCPAHLFAGKSRKEYPFLQIENANVLIRKLRTIKQPCEIAAIREAEKISRDGITAMMKASRPGMRWRYDIK